MARPKNEVVKMRAIPPKKQPFRSITRYTIATAILVAALVITTAVLLGPIISGLLCLAIAGGLLFAYARTPREVTENIEHKKRIPPPINDPFFNLENNLSKNPSPIKGDYIFVDFCFSATQNNIRAKIEQQKVQEVARSEAAKKCHFGLACFANFAIAAVTKPQKIILFDYDPVVVEFNKVAIEALQLSNSYAEFKQLLVQKCRENKQFKGYEFLPRLDKKGNIIQFSAWGWDRFENLKRIFDMPESFLANEQDFAYIKKLADEQNIHVFLGNVLDPDVIRNTTDLLDKNGYYLDTMYLSNVYDWFPKQAAVLDEHINMLCSKQGTTLIKGTHDGITVSSHSKSESAQKVRKLTL
jgi:hypothetical protein